MRSSKDMAFSWLPLGDSNMASSRLRCHQVHGVLSQRGIRSCVGFDPAADVLILQKKMSDEAFTYAALMRRAGRAVLFDIDDLPDPPEQARIQEIRRMMMAATFVTTATPEQREFLLSEALPGRSDLADKVRVWPNMVDYGLERPVERRHENTDPLRIMWFGHPENFAGMGGLLRGLAKSKNIEFRVFTSKTGELAARYPEFHFVEWRLETFPSLARECDLCILTHEGGRASRAKSANKMTAAIALGVPVLASRTPDYERVARMAGVENCLFDSADSLRQCLETVASPRARDAYLARAQAPVWEAFNPGAITDLFLDLAAKAWEWRDRFPVDAAMKMKMAAAIEQSAQRPWSAGLKSLAGAMHRVAGGEMTLRDFERKARVRLALARSRMAGAFRSMKTHTRGKRG